VSTVVKASYKVGGSYYRTLEKRLAGSVMANVNVFATLTSILFTCPQVQCLATARDIRAICPKSLWGTLRAKLVNGTDGTKHVQYSLDNPGIQQRRARVDALYMRAARIIEARRVAKNIAAEAVKTALNSLKGAAHVQDQTPTEIDLAPIRVE
jgi:hypothetical protein